MHLIKQHNWKKNPLKNLGNNNTLALRAVLYNKYLLFLSNHTKFKWVMTNPLPNTQTTGKHESCCKHIAYEFGCTQKCLKDRYQKSAKSILDLYYTWSEKCLKWESSDFQKYKICHFTTYLTLIWNVQKLT